MADAARMFDPLTDAEQQRLAQPRLIGADEAWAPVEPVPTDAPPPPAAHPTLGRAAARWAYRTAGRGFSGYVCRFDTATGKEYRPLRWGRLNLFGSHSPPLAATKRNGRQNTPPLWAGIVYRGARLALEGLGRPAPAVPAARAPRRPRRGRRGRRGREGRRRGRAAVPPGGGAVDLGLRLADVEAWELASEELFYTGPGGRALRDTGAIRAKIGNNVLGNGGTEAELEFLVTRRVELNAFTSRQLVEWIEGKLAAHGVIKVVPDEATLRQAAQGCALDLLVEREIRAHAARLRADVERLEFGDLAGEVRRRLAAEPGLSWDAAVGAVVRRLLAGGGP